MDEAVEMLKVVFLVLESLEQCRAKQAWDKTDDNN